MADQKMSKVTAGVSKQSPAKAAVQHGNTPNKAPTVRRAVLHLAGRKTLSGARKTVSMAKNKATGYLKRTFVEEHQDQDSLNLDTAGTVKKNVQQTMQVKNNVQRTVSTVKQAGTKAYRLNKAIKKKTNTGVSKSTASKTKTGKGAATAAYQNVRITAQTVSGKKNIAAAGKAAGKAKRAATVARTAAGTAKAAKAAVTAASVPISAAKTAATVSAATAATAGTGGAAAVVTIPLGLVRKLGQILIFRRDNNPLKRIFGNSGNRHSADMDIVSGILGRLASSILVVPIILMLLAGVFFGGVCVIGDIILSSPLKYLYLDSEELSAIAADNPEYDNLEYDELQTLYDNKIKALKKEAKEAGCSSVTMRYHAEAREATNYTDVLASFFGHFLATDFLQGGSDGTEVTTVSDLFLTDTAKALFTEVMEQMCTLEVKGSGSKQKAVISLMTCEEYISASGCSQEIAEDIRTLYRELSKGNISAGVQELPADTQEYLQELVSQGGVPGTVISFALSVQGTPYSQAYRNSGDYYDCSSFVYYCYRAAGISMSYGGANTAAAEAQYCQEYGQIIDVADLVPGDLLFYSYVTNGRYKNISHVEMYLGNGLIIDCTETPGVAVRQFTTDRLVVCGRPY